MFDILGAATHGVRGRNSPSGSMSPRETQASDDFISISPDPTDFARYILLSSAGGFAAILYFSVQLFRYHRKVGSESPPPLKYVVGWLMGLMLYIAGALVFLRA